MLKIFSIAILSIASVIVFASCNKTVETTDGDAAVSADTDADSSDSVDSTDVSDAVTATDAAPDVLAVDATSDVQDVASDVQGVALDATKIAD